MTSAGAGAGPPRGDGFRRVPAFFLVVFFTALFCVLTIAVFDSDFWWHLASGRWMWEHRALLRSDPFDFTSAIFGPSSQGGYQITQYWGAQVLQYAAYLFAGLNGVVLLRAAVFTALFFFLYRLLRRAGAGPLLSVLLLALAVRAIVRELAYISDRPQMWSSLFFVVLLVILEHLREGRRWARFALPPFMILWANLHGGYILGVVVLAIAVAAAHFARHEERRRMLLVAAAAIALTGCNPAGYETLIAFPLSLFPSSAAYVPGIFEMDSLFKYVSIPALPGTMPGLTAVFLLPFLTLLPRLKSLFRDRRDLFLIYLLTLGMGIKSQRYLVFMVPMACWVSAINIAAARASLPQAWQRPLHRLLTPRTLGALTVLVLAALATSYARVAIHSSVLRPSAIFRHEAEGAVDYLNRSGFRGNVFNEYTLGGYLAWRLHPEMKIFIYGRMPFPELLSIYNEVVNQPTKTVALTGAGRVSYFYQKVFDDYAIDAVIIPAGDSRSGDVIRLANQLAWDEAWALVYADPAALVFLRKTPALAPLVGNALPKSAVFDNMIAVAVRVARNSHGKSSPIWRRSLGLAHYGKGQKEEALRIFDEYVTLAPNDANGLQLRNGVAKELGVALRQGNAAIPDGNDSAPNRHRR